MLPVDRLRRRLKLALDRNPTQKAMPVIGKCVKKQEISLEICDLGLSQTSIALSVNRSAGITAFRRSLKWEIMLCRCPPEERRVMMIKA